MMKHQLHEYGSRIAVLLCGFVVVTGLMGCMSKRMATGAGYRAPGTSHQNVRRGTGVRRAHEYANRHAPGLGTAYGRSVYAPVSFVSFVRASSGPSAMMRIYYNDPQGVMAMARFARGHHCCGPVSVRHANGVSLQLVNPRHGSTLTGLAMAGKTVVMGRHGSRYHILIRNFTGGRKEVVVSVDGLDVIDGRRGQLTKRGYILRPYGVLQIKGFRRSRARVAAFRFSSVRRSYASRTGQGGNVGVIGVAVFNERRRVWNREQLRRRFGATPFGHMPSHIVR